jgi:ferric-dicitrate binding protein FerR (iron transport regulator)
MIRDKDDNALAELLRLAGPPPAIAAERTARVRQVVQRAWEHRIEERRQRRRQLAAFLVPALAALLIVVIRLPWREEAKPPGPVARWLSTGAVIKAGDLLESGPRLRSAVQLDSGTSIRIDRNTKLRLVSSREVELVHGAVYVDDGSDRGQAIEIRTAFGTIRDIGTQFEARLDESRLRVRVRSGIVSVSDGRETVSGSAGAELTSSSGQILRGRAPVYGPDWDWVAAAVPAFDIEGRTLAAFLAHLTREHGWTIRFSSPVVERTAADTVLHGSIDGLSAEDSLATVVPAAGLRYALRDGELTLTAPGSRP